MSRNTNEENKLEELLLQYTYFYGIRRSNKDKQKFYAYIEQKFHQELGLPITFDKLPVAVTKIGYCIVGDLSNAETVLIAPVDTLRKTFLRRYRFYPLDEKKSGKMKAAASTVDMLIEWTIALAVFALTAYFFKNRFIISLVCTFLVLLIFRFAMRNIFNFNNSAPLALMTYMEVNQKDKQRYAYVFLDQAADSYVSLRLFLIKYKEQCQKVKQIFFLNHLAHGEHLILAHGDTAKQASRLAAALHAQDIVVTNDGEGPLCFNASSKLMMLMAADRSEKGEFFVKDIRCGKDRTMDVKRLKAIAASLMEAE